LNVEDLSKFAERLKPTTRQIVPVFDDL